MDESAKRVESVGVAVQECVPAHIDQSLILPTGTRRTRKAPEKYVDPAYAQLMLADVPDEEQFAAVEDDDLDDDEDAVSEGDEEESEDETGDGDDDDFIIRDSDDEESEDDADFSDDGSQDESDDGLDESDGSDEDSEDEDEDCTIENATKSAAPVKRPHDAVDAKPKVKKPRA